MFFQGFGLQTFNVFQKHYRRNEKANQVVVVEIDENSLASLGQWPWPRLFFTIVLDNIAKAQRSRCRALLLITGPARERYHLCRALRRVVPRGDDPVGPFGVRSRGLDRRRQGRKHAGRARQFGIGSQYRPAA